MQNDTSLETEQTFTRIFLEEDHCLLYEDVILRKKSFWLFSERLRQIHIRLLDLQITVNESVILNIACD